MWELQDGVLRGIRDGIVSGQPLKATVANIWHDDGTWTHRVTDRMISGEKQEDVKIRFSRKSAAGPMPDSIKEQILNNLIGNWDVTITMGGETLTGTASAKWSAGEHAVIIEEQGSAPFEVRIIGVLGWEANNKELVHHAFMSSGDYFTIRYTDIGKDKWSGRVSGTFRGSPRNSPASVEWEGDSFTYRDSPGGEDFVYRATRQ